MFGAVMEISFLKKEKSVHLYMGKTMDKTSDSRDESRIQTTLCVCLTSCNIIIRKSVYALKILVIKPFTGLNAIRTTLHG